MSSSVLKKRWHLLQMHELTLWKKGVSSARKQLPAPAQPTKPASAPQKSASNIGNIGNTANAANHFLGTAKKPLPTVPFKTTAANPSPIIATTPTFFAPPMNFSAYVEQLKPMDWPALSQCMKECTRCPLHQGRIQVVPGEGAAQAPWLFVGEGPGAEEDETGRPFVGKAGKLLDQMLRALFLSRKHSVYIANAVKCRPPENRTPTPEESSACYPFLLQQIRLVRPKIIVALGRSAAQTLMQREIVMSAVRQKQFFYEHQELKIPLVTTYHPAYLLRSPTEKKKAWDDLCFAMDWFQKL